MKKNYLNLVMPMLVLTFFLNQNIRAQVWAPLGNGLPLPTCQALAIFNGDVIAGGIFDTAGNVAANDIAEWNGSTWSSLGGGLAMDTLTYGLWALANFKGELYAGGVFDSIGGQPINGVAKWNGSTWSALGQGIHTSGNGSGAPTLFVYDTNLIVAGGFDSVGGIGAPFVAEWNGTSWSAMPGSDSLINANDFAVYGGTLYAAGTFAADTGAGAPFYGLASWNGSNWSLLRSSSLNTNGVVNALCVYQDNLYAAGAFDSIGGKAAANIAEWNGATWAPLGIGLLPDTGAYPAYVYYTMVVYNNELYVPGGFTDAGGLPDTSLAVWNGTSWLSVGSCSGYSFGSYVQALIVDSNTDALYVGGTFTQAGGVAANNVAELTFPEGITEVKSSSAVSVYPNPNNGKFSVSLQNAAGEYIINIYNVIGDRIAQTAIKPDKTELDLNGVARGVYFYRINSWEGDALATGEIIIQ